MTIGTILLFYGHEDVVGNSVPEESFQSQIQVAFNSYLNGSINGIENDAITGESTKNTDMECGLDKFDKLLFKSDYSIRKIEDSKYGGKIGYLTFTTQPDTIFWVWVYNIGDNERPGYVLRAFCKDKNFD